MSIMEADLHTLKINDPFLGQYQQLVRDVVIPYQWDALNDRVTEAEPSHAITNFRIAAGLEKGEFYGMVFQDSDCLLYTSP
ncbi:glycoside hydrolase family 127 protein, partial [Enterobacter sp. 63]